MIKRSDFQITPYADGFMVNDYSADAGGLGARYCGFSGRWNEQPQIVDPFPTTTDAEVFIGRLIAAIGETKPPSCSCCEAPIEGEHHRVCKGCWPTVPEQPWPLRAQIEAMGETGAAILSFPATAHGGMENPDAEQPSKREDRQRVERVLLDLQDHAEQTDIGRAIQVTRTVFQELGISVDVGYDEAIRFCVGLLMEEARKNVDRGFHNTAATLHAAVDRIGKERRS